MRKSDGVAKCHATNETIRLRKSCEWRVDWRRCHIRRFESREPVKAAEVGRQNHQKVRKCRSKICRIVTRTLLSVRPHGEGCLCGPSSSSSACPFFAAPRKDEVQPPQTRSAAPAAAAVPAPAAAPAPPRAPLAVINPSAANTGKEEKAPTIGSPAKSPAHLTPALFEALAAASRRNELHPGALAAILKDPTVATSFVLRELAEREMSSESDSD